MGQHGYNHGDFGWNELAVEEPNTVLSFYTGIFGWKTEEMEMPNGTYTVLLNGEEKIGGITLKPAESGAPSTWMPYLTVDDVDESAEKVVTLGGTIIAPPADIPVENGPRLAIVQDPAGTTFGIITYAPAAT